MIQHLLLLSVVSASDLGPGQIMQMSIHQSGWIARLILIAITLLSVLSWAVMGWKYFTFRRTTRQNAQFSNVWESRAGDLTTIFEESAALLASSSAKVFAEGYRELKVLARVIDRRPVITREIVQSIERSIDRVIAREIINMERHMIILASTANASPLLGLLGTVWGVLNTFFMMGVNQNATIATVAPGISEALITTVFGLVAAIPAVMGYNFFNNRANEIVLEMEDFSSRFISLLERNVAQREL